MARTWAQQVAEGKRLVKAEGDIKWGLGDLALEVAPLSPLGVNNDSTEALMKFADAIGCEFSALREYRRIANEYPTPATRVAGASWSVHRELATCVDAVKMIKGLVREGRATVDNARALLGQKPTRQPVPTTTKDKAAAATELLADPAVRREVVKREARTSARDLASDILKAGPAAADQVYHELRQQRAGVDTSPANRKAAEAKANEIGGAMIKAAQFDLGCIGIPDVLDAYNERVAEAISTEMVSGRTLALIEEAAKRLYETAVAGKAFVV